MTYLMPGRHVRVGDVITLRDVSHRVDAIEPWEHGAEGIGPARLARCELGIEIVLYDDRPVHVATGPFLDRVRAAA